MSAAGGDQGGPDLGILKRFLQPKPKARAGEQCEFCNENLPDEHRHVVNVETRGMMCACRACGLLFTNEGAARGKYRSVPTRYVSLGDSVLSEGQWDELQVPVSMAFFFFNSQAGRTVAFYPGPAGATESLLSLDVWSEVLKAQPALATLVPDVEALLVSRGRTGEACYIVPIDACYELVGRIKLCWKGFDGGEEAHREIDAFFASVRARCFE